MSFVLSLKTFLSASILWLANSFSLKIVFLFLVVAISAIGVTYGVMSGEIDTAPINDCVDYTIYRFSIASGEKNIDNYKKSFDNSLFEVYSKIINQWK